MAERWREVADAIEALVASPTDEQFAVAKALDAELPDGLPAPVASVVLRARLSSALREKLRGDAGVPENLEQLEAELGIADRTGLITGSRQEVGAWFEARYMVVTARGLRALEPMIGDVVARADAPADHMIVSSIGDNGRVYMKGGRGKSAWPNHLQVISRAWR